MRRSLVRLPKGRVVRNSPCSSADRSPALLEQPFDDKNALASCGIVHYGSFFDLHCILHSCYRPVQCRSCLYQHYCNLSPDSVPLPVTV